MGDGERGGSCRGWEEEGREQSRAREEGLRVVQRIGRGRKRVESGERGGRADGSSGRRRERANGD